MENHKLAVISDVHSNIHALEAVLRDIERKNVDQIVNLGDALIGPVDPVATAERMMKLPNLINVMGNGDEMLLQDKVRSESYDFTRPLLNQWMLEWLRTFHQQWIDGNMLFLHGSPHSNHAYLMEKVTPVGMVSKSLEELDRELSAVQQNYIVCGHSHLSRSVYTPSGKLIMNPGSVGLPAYSDEKPYLYDVENFTPHAKYMVLSIEDNKIVHIERNEILYDWDLAAQTALQNNRKDYEVAIRTGTTLK
jgi:putative phosphoesterase